MASSGIASFFFRVIPIAAELELASPNRRFGSLPDKARTLFQPNAPRVDPQLPNLVRHRPTPRQGGIDGSGAASSLAPIRRVQMRRVHHPRLYYVAETLGELGVNSG